MRLLIAGLLLVLAVPAVAQTPRGCDNFEWPLDIERQALANRDKIVPGAGNELRRTTTQAFELRLTPLAEAKLAKPPERAPKQADAYAGMVSFAADSQVGRYRITLPEAGYIDVIQNGRYLKPTAFTGALDCPGLRKSVEFDIGPEAFVVQFSDVAEAAISFALTRSD